MSYTAATMQARVLGVVRDGPFTADATFEAKVLAAVTDVFNMLIATNSWWFDRTNTTASTTMPDVLDLIFYHQSVAEGFALAGNSSQVGIHMSMADKYLSEFIRAYGSVQ